MGEDSYGPKLTVYIAYCKPHVPQNSTSEELYCLILTFL